MAPPLEEGTSPSTISRFSKVAITVAKTSKTRSNESARMMVWRVDSPVMVKFPAMSKSPCAAASSFTPAIVNTYSPLGSEMVLASGAALDSITAARSEQFPPASAHTPSPGLTSGVSSIVLTLNCANEDTDSARAIMSNKCCFEEQQRINIMGLIEVKSKVIKLVSTKSNLTQPSFEIRRTAKEETLHFNFWLSELNALNILFSARIGWSFRYFHQCCNFYIGPTFGFSRVTSCCFEC
jgi:hypothetical protein